MGDNHTTWIFSKWHAMMWSIWFREVLRLLHKSKRSPLSTIRISSPWWNNKEYKEYNYISLQDYLKAHLYSTVVTQDFLNAMQPHSEEGMNITTIMRPWIYQMGFPVVTITDIGNGQLKMTQTRFLANPKDDPSLPESPYQYVDDKCCKVAYLWPVLAKIISVDDLQICPVILVSLAGHVQVLNPVGQNVRQCQNPLPDISRSLPAMSGTSGIFRDHCSDIILLLLFLTTC